MDENDNPPHFPKEIYVAYLFENSLTFSQPSEGLVIQVIAIVNIEIPWQQYPLNLKFTSNKTAPAEPKPLKLNKTSY